MLLIHTGNRPREFALPPLSRSIVWNKFIDTAADSPLDIYPDVDGPPPPAQGPILLQERSLICYVAAEGPQA